MKHFPSSKRSDAFFIEKKSVLTDEIPAQSFQKPTEEASSHHREQKQIWDNYIAMSFADSVEISTWCYGFAQELAWLDVFQLSAMDCAVPKFGSLPAL